MKTLSKLTLLMLALLILLAGCKVYIAPFDHEPTTGPPLKRVSTAACLNSAVGHITIWHAGDENVPAFTCAPKVIVSLLGDTIAYDEQALWLDDVYTLIDGDGYVFDNEELRNGDWPDTIGPTDTSESHNLGGSL